MIGYALRWGSPARILGARGHYDEIFRRGAFAASIAGGRVRLVNDHDFTEIVALQSNGTLTLVEDWIGLRVDALAMETMAGDDAIDAVRCRYRAGLSISFREAQSEWSTIGDSEFREVVSCRLHEISVVRNPAYKSSEINAGKMRIERFLSDSAADNRTARLARLVALEAELAKVKG